MSGYDMNEKVQKDMPAKSSKFGLKVLIISVVGLLLLVVLGIVVANRFNPEARFQKYLQKAYVEPLVNDPNFSNLKSGKEIAKYLVDKNPQMLSLVGDDEDTVFTGGKEKYGYNLKFFKNGTCSLERYNCSIECSNVLYHVSYQPVKKEEQIVTKFAKIFYDEKGKIKYLKIDEKIKLKF